MTAARRPLQIDHPDGTVVLTPLPERGPEWGRITVTMADPEIFSPLRELDTDQPDDLLRLIVKAKGPAYLCDELSREANPDYVERHLRHAITGYVEPSRLKGSRILDFGSGAGASTMCLHRITDAAEIVGIELVDSFIDVARRRAEVRGVSDRVKFLRSPEPGELPADVGTFDFVVMSANYEHLLPDERRELMPLIWSVLRPGGVLFLNQTPHRWFPLESHTTGLPLINYLPDRVTSRAARLSKRIPASDDWPTLLRKGIRGGSVTEVLATLRGHGGEPTLLEPLDGDRVDLWLQISGGSRMRSVKQAMAAVIKAGHAMTGHYLLPDLTLAIRRG